jgi:hypothetical protein
MVLKFIKGNLTLLISGTSVLTAMGNLLKLMGANFILYYHKEVSYCISDNRSLLATVPDIWTYFLD